MGDPIKEAYGIGGTIDQLKDTCETRGWKLVAKLSELKHGTINKDGHEEMANIAEYESQTWRKDIWKSLHFIEMSATDTEAGLRATWETKGETWIFTEQLYVANTIKSVIGFGLPNS